MDDPKQNRKILFDFLKSMLMPTLIGKSFVLYFGIMLADHPDEGYGYGLIAAMAFTVIALLLFIWKYRNYDDSN